VSVAAGLWNAFAEGPDEVFARCLVPAIFDPMADQLLAVCPLRAGDRVLDVACGSGAVVGRAAAAVGPDGLAVGLDLSAGMLALARRDHPSPRLCRGDAADQPFAEGAFDVVLCQQGLPFVSTPARGLSEMRRVLRPGGRLALDTYGPLASCPPFAAIAAALARVVDAAAALLPPFALSEGDRLRRLVDEAGFVDVEAESRTVEVRFPTARDLVLGLAAGGSSMRRVMAAVPLDRRAALLADVEGALAPFRRPDGLVVPQTCLYVRAVRPPAAR
jgi:SAM-dependent methyltransferase